DKDGNRWFATYGGGLSKFDGKQWTNYTSEGFGPPQPHAWRSYPEGAGLGDMWVYDIAFDKQGTLWAATWKGASRMNGDGSFKTYATLDGLADKWVYALGIDGAGVYWFGTEGGVSRYDGKRWTNYTHKNGLGADIQEAIPGNPHHGQPAHHADPKKSNLASNPNYVMSLAIDANDNKWFGTWGSGLSRFDGKTWKTYTTRDGLAGNFVFALKVDQVGVLWAGTNGGVSYFDGKVWKSYTRKDGLMDDFVYSIGVDKDNNKWFGTRIGVSKLKQGLVVVNAMKHSPWATSTVFATIPIAIFIGFYMRNIRPGRVLEGTLIGVALLLFSVAGGGWIAHSPALSGYFDLDGLSLAWFVIGYGFLAAILPVWLLLAPRDYLSTFMKLGTVILLAIAIVILRPEVKMPALTQFIDGSGP
ncbi:MAG: carbon starvation CstA family protein, partial [Gammaproteobacteria bacterium]